MTEAAPAQGRASLSLAILLGDPRISGGTNVILEHALAMRAAGHAVTLVTPRPAIANDLVWKPGAERLGRSTVTSLRGTRFDLALATWWRSAYDLAALDANACAYFVQSIESRFFAGEHPPQQALARASYALPLPVITEAHWIAATLQANFGRDVRVVRNGIDKSAFRPDGPSLAAPCALGVRVLVEGSLGVSYKRTELAIRLCQRAGVREIWLLTSTPCSHYDGVDRVLSRIPPARVGDALRACDLMLKLSTVEGMFGPPLEMMHCGGTAITTDVTGHEEFMRDGENGIVVRCGEELAVVDHLRHLATDRDCLRRLRAGAVHTSRLWPSWNVSTQQMRTELERLAADPGTPSAASLRDAVGERARARPATDTGLWPRVRRHARAFTRTRLPAIAARLDRGERSVLSRHPVAPLPDLEVPRLSLPTHRLRIAVVGDGNPFAEHWPRSAADFDLTHLGPSAANEPVDIVLTHACESQAKLGAWPGDPFTILLALERVDSLQSPAAVHAILVADLVDGLALRQRRLPVVGTWLPPVRDEFLAIDSSHDAWRRRRQATLCLVDDHELFQPGDLTLSLATSTDTLVSTFADTRVVALPRRSRRPRLAAARAMLAMAAGCLVLSPPLALDYGALPGEHFLPCDLRRWQRLAGGGEHSDVVRSSGRMLAARHAATARLRRLIADISAGGPAQSSRMLDDGRAL